MPRRLALLLLLLPGCIIITDDDAPPSDTDAVLVDDTCPGEPAWVTRATTDLDDLIVDVGYGGCREAPVWACWDGTTYDSLPPQVVIEIHHGESGDCDAAFQTTARFDLGPMLESVGRGDEIVIRADDQTTTWYPWAF